MRCVFKVIYSRESLLPSHLSNVPEILWVYNKFINNNNLRKVSQIKNFFMLLNYQKQCTKKFSEHFLEVSGNIKNNGRLHFYVKHVFIAGELYFFIFKSFCYDTPEFSEILSCRKKNFCALTKLSEIFSVGVCFR